MSMIPPKSPYCFCGRDVPEEHATVPANGRESCIVGRDADVEDFVAVRGVGLDELCGFRGLEWVGGGGGRRAGGVVQSDGTVRGAG